MADKDIKTQNTSKKSVAAKTSASAKRTKKPMTKKAPVKKVVEAVEHREDKCYDVIVIGAGVAGLSAAIEAGNNGKQVALLDANDSGGSITASPAIYGLPGFPEMSGHELVYRLYNHVALLPTIDYIRQNAVYLDYRYGMFRVTIDDKSLVCGRSIIFATGKTCSADQLNKLRSKYFNKLSFTIGDLDDEQLVGKDVIVLGNEKETAEYALELAKYCKKVYILSGQSNVFSLSCPPALASKISAKKNIQFFSNSSIAKVEPDKNNSERLTVWTSLESQISCSMVYWPFSILATHPDTAITGAFVEKDANGYIVSGDTATKKVPGVFAAGTCRTGSTTVLDAITDGIAAARKMTEFIDTQSLAVKK